MSQETEQTQFQRDIEALDALIVSQSDGAKLSQRLAELEKQQSGSARPLQPGPGLPMAEDFQNHTNESETLVIVSSEPATKPDHQ